MTNTQSDKRARIRTIRRLHHDGLLNDAAFAAAVNVLRPVSAWFAWSGQMLLLFGTTLILAGIIFFFAYNWAAMGRFIKLGLVETGIAACIIGSHLRGITRPSGKVLVLSASVLVGVLLAVYGQIYQTGADPFELFVGWAALILGWVIVAEFAALWFVWLVILNTGVILYWIQVGYPCYSIRYESLCMALAVLNGLILALREFGLLWGLEWLGGKWLRGILFTASLACLLVPAIGLIVNFEDAKLVTAVAACAWGGAAFGGYKCYRHKLRDMLPLAVIVMNICIILLTFIAKVLFDSIGTGAEIFLLFALIILGVVAGAVFWLRNIAAAMADEMKKMADKTKEQVSDN